MAIPENRKIPAEQLSGIEAVIDGRVLPANPDQIVDVNGLATVASVYTETTGTVTFNTNKVQGSSASPEYNFLTVSNTNPRDLNNVVVKHSSLVVPAVLVDPLAETWGTKPAWLIVQGDAYLVGEDNINTLSFVFYELIKISGVSYHDTVICTVTAHTAMNRDADRIALSLLIHHKYDENNVVQPDSIVNSSIYGDLFPCTVENSNTSGLLPYYNLLSGVNYAIVLGVGASADTGNVATAPFRTITSNESLERILSGEEMTIIARKKFLTLGTDANIPIINNSVDGVGGFEFLRVSTGDMSFSIYYPAGNRFFLMTLTDKITRDTGFYTMAVTFSKPAVDQLVIKGYLKSSDNLIAFSEVFSTTNTNALNTDTTLVGGDLRLDKLGVSSTNVKPVEDDDIRMYARVLTEAEISTIMTELDG